MPVSNVGKSFVRPSQDRLDRLLQQQGLERSFLADVPLRNVTRNGVAGVEMTVRLTSYRSLPLSCIADIELKIDGEAVNQGGLLLGLNGVDHRVATCTASTSEWWFILDTATLFAPRAIPLRPGLHEVEATLATVEPYMTAGRFTLRNSDRRQLIVE